MNKQSLKRKVKPVSEQMKEHKQSSKKNKYNAQRVTVDGIKFDSKKEANRYCDLKLLERAGVISDLKLQVFFELIPSNKTERGVAYVADFTYYENGIYVVEDTKSEATKKIASYIIKRKLMLEKHGITINEI